MTNTFEIYTDKSGKKYKMYPTLVCFDKKTELVVDQESIKTINIEDLKIFLRETIKRQFQGPLQGSINIDKNNDFFIKKHINHELDHEIYNYQISFDEVEDIE